MRRLFFSFMILIGAAAGRTAAARPTSALQQDQELTPGLYRLKIAGLLCHACARAVDRELTKLNKVQSVKTDFETAQVRLEIKLDEALRAASLRRALNRAARNVNLETEFKVLSVQRIP